MKRDGNISNNSGATETDKSLLFLSNVNFNCFTFYVSIEIRQVVSY